MGSTACTAHRTGHSAHLAGQQAQRFQRLDGVALAAQQARHITPHCVVGRMLRIRGRVEQKNEVSVAPHCVVGRVLRAGGGTVHGCDGARHGKPVKARASSIKQGAPVT